MKVCAIQTLVSMRNTEALEIFLGLRFVLQGDEIGGGHLARRRFGAALDEGQSGEGMKLDSGRPRFRDDTGRNGQTEPQELGGRTVEFDA